MKMNKRLGFSTRYLRKPHVVGEKFDSVFGTYPNKLYILTDSSGEFAITGDKETDYVNIKAIDKRNKYQWVLVDADTGTICFFTDLKNYMNISIVNNGEIDVRRSDILKNGTFLFNSDHSISLRSNPEYYLAFNSKKLGNESNVPLEVIKKTSADLNKYSYKWNFELVYDLRDLTEYIDRMEDIKQYNDNSNEQVDNLQKLVENNKKLYETENGYMNDKIKNCEERINKYESNWFVKWFLKD